MLKFILKTIFILLIFIVAGLGGAYFYAGNIVKKAVETVVPEVTQTTASLGHMDISLLKGSVSLSNLKIGNPKGYTQPESFSVKNIAVSFEPKSIFSDKIVINQIVIDGTHVTAEATYQDGNISSNLTQIKKNVDSYIQKNTPKSEPQAKKEKQAVVPQEQSKQVVIKDLKIIDSGITVSALEKTAEIKLPDIHQQNLGEKGKALTWQQALVKIIDLISDESIQATINGVKAIVKQNVDDLKQNINETKEQAQGIIDTVKGLF